LAYEKTVAAFLEHLGLKRAEADIADVSRTDIVAFRDSLYCRELAPDTVNRYIKILRMLFNAAHRDRFVLENPVEHVEPVKDASNARRRPFTIPEIQAVLAVADPEWQSLIKFGLYSGQRLGDLALLTWSNIDLARDELRLVTRKTGKRLTIPLAQPLREHIEALGPVIRRRLRSILVPSKLCARRVGRSRFPMDSLSCWHKRGCVNATPMRVVASVGTRKGWRRHSASTHCGILLSRC
jgi:integrase